MSSAPGAKRPRGPPAVPKPSSSIILVSPRNQILLLCRVKTSSSFPSAHVFPGGNVDEAQDGPMPAVGTFERHVDNETYRLAAIRECFEESGLLLVHDVASPASDSDSQSSPLNPPQQSPRLISVSAADRDAARRAIHANSTRFVDWIARRGGRPDTAGLYPFTRFVTPTTVPKRFTTQMYIYFLPLDAGEESRLADGSEGAGNGGVTIPTPTSDGGVEHTTAQFLWPQQWLDLAGRNEIIMYPPQVYLCHLIADFFPAGEWNHGELQKQRERCVDFMKTGEPPWADKVMSPDVVLGLGGGRVALGLKKPGPELEGSGRSGDADRVVITRHSKEGPRDVQVRWKADVMKEWRESQKAAEEGKSKM